MKVRRLLATSALQFWVRAGSDQVKGISVAVGDGRGLLVGDKVAVSVGGGVDVDGIAGNVGGADVGVGAA